MTGAMCFPEIWPGGLSPPVICAAVWSFCNAQEKIHIQNETKQDSGMFCKELFKITPGLFEAEKMRRLAGLDNVLSVYLMTCSSLAADLDCGCYICMVCVRKHSWGTFKPEQHAVFGGDNILWLMRFTCLLLLITRKPFRAHCQK